MPASTWRWSRRWTAQVLGGLLVVLAGCGGGDAGSGGFCGTHNCIASFSTGNGSIVRCADDMWSHSGGRPGACSHHGGVAAQTEPSEASSSSRASAPSTTSAVPAAAEAVAAVAEPAPSEASLKASARQYVSRFYDALDLADYRSAWGRLPSAVRAQAGDFSSWKRGYSETLSNAATDISVAIVGGDAATVSLTLRATDLDVCGEEVHQRFAVSWQLSRVAGRWKAASISSTKTRGRAPRTNESACQPAGVSPNAVAPPEDADSAPGFCDVHDCIENFDRGTGSITVCADGMYSHSGGRPGACSGHGGLGRGSSSSSPSPDSTPLSPTVPSSGGTVQVHGYYRKDGTYVRPYTRRAPCTYC